MVHSPLSGLRLDRTDDDLPLHHLRVLEAHQLCTTTTLLPQIVAVLSAVVDQIVRAFTQACGPTSSARTAPTRTCVRWQPRPDRSLSRWANGQVVQPSASSPVSESASALVHRRTKEGRVLLLCGHGHVEAHRPLAAHRCADLEQRRRGRVRHSVLTTVAWAFGGTCVYTTVSAATLRAGRSYFSSSGAHIHTSSHCRLRMDAAVRHSGAPHRSVQRTERTGVVNRLRNDSLCR